MTAFDPESNIVKAMKGWDDVKPTSACLHCQGTNRAPGDGRTECGFCIPDAEFYYQSRGAQLLRSVTQPNVDKPGTGGQWSPEKGWHNAIEAEERTAADETWVS